MPVVQLQPVMEAERFSALITFAMQQAGWQQQLVSDSGMELLRQTSGGLPRHAGRILTTAMRMAVPKGLNMNSTQAVSKSACQHQHNQCQ